MAKIENTVRNEIREVAEKPPKTRKRKSKKDSKPFSLSLGINPRVIKISGLLLISASVFITLAMGSFLFSWQSDQSVINNLDWGKLSAAKPEMTKNWMGLFGAWISHLLIFRWFGIASFLFAPVLFLTGFRWLFEARNINLSRVYGLAAISILFFSVLLGFVFNTIENRFNFLGGEFGYESNTWLGGLVGSFGVAILLIIAFLSYLILAFNINFRLPKFAMARAAEQAPENEYETESRTGNVFEPDAGADEEEDEVDPDEFKLIVLPEKKHRSPADLLKENNEKAAANPAGGIDFKIKTETTAPAAVVPITPQEARNYDGSWYKYPGLDLLRDHEIANAKVDSSELEERKNLIVETLENYKIKIDKIEATIGPTVTLYEIVPAAGIRISRIKSLEDDIALSLSALGIRIIAPMPGKGTIGIEVPNQNPQIVSLKEALASPAFINSTYDLPIVLGKTINNQVFVGDLTKMPHLLMAGATGQGKSVGINTIIASILYKKHPEDVKFILIDPKKVELSLFKNIENHFLPELPDGQEAIITDTRMVVDVLKSLCVEMDDRYDKLKDAQVRNIKEYNKKIEKGLLDQAIHKKLPYIILVMDELADLMMTAGKEVELPIARLAQLARAIGIHLIVATQRPSVNIITGTIKANFPSRIAFRVTSRIDSRTILDTGGAEQLIGRGDMLYSTGNDIIRLQCPFIDTDEVDRLTKHIQGQPYPEPFRLNIFSEDGTLNGFDDFDGDMDPLFEDAARLVVNTQQGSTSMLQRRLKLGYNRAGRLMDQLEKAKIVGANEGSKAREVLYSDESALEQYLKDLNSRKY
jgi:DNA segregation ATPase FtsK/SpoIIIE, S-DNA-T family